MLAIHGDLALGDLIIGMAGHDFGQGAFAGPVRSHDRVHFALGHGEAKAADNVLVADRNVEIINSKFVHKADWKYRLVRSNCERIWADASGGDWVNLAHLNPIISIKWASRLLAKHQRES